MEHNFNVYDTSFNIYYDDDIEVVINKFCSALESFVNVNIEYDDDGIAKVTLSPKQNPDPIEFFSSFFDFAKEVIDDWETKNG